MCHGLSIWLDFKGDLGRQSVFPAHWTPAGRAGPIGGGQVGTRALAPGQPHFPLSTVLCMPGASLLIEAGWRSFHLDCTGSGSPTGTACSQNKQWDQYFLHQSRGGGPEPAGYILLAFLQRGARSMLRGPGVLHLPSSVGGCDPIKSIYASPALPLVQLQPAPRREGGRQF